MDSRALATLTSIGSDLTVPVGAMSFAETQADSDRQEQELGALQDRLQKATSSYNRTVWLLDGAPEHISGHGYADRQKVLAAFHDSPDPVAFVEEFEANLAALKKRLDALSILEECTEPRSNN